MLDCAGLPHAGLEALAALVLWMGTNGEYVHYTNCRSAVKMDRPAKL